MKAAFFSVAVAITCFFAASAFADTYAGKAGPQRITTGQMMRGGLCESGNLQVTVTDSNVAFSDKDNSRNATATLKDGNAIFTGTSGNGLGGVNYEADISVQSNGLGGTYKVMGRNGGCEAPISGTRQ